MRKKTITILMILSALLCLMGCEKEEQYVTNEAGLRSISEDMTFWPPGLGESEIPIYEENPLTSNYLIVFDGSGSMDGSKLVTAKEALKQFISIIPDESNIGLVAFDIDGISQRVPLGQDRSLLIHEIENVNAGGGTPLKTSISLAYDGLVEQAFRQVGYGEYFMVIVTDGEASGGEDPVRVVNMILDESPVMIHTIGFQIDKRHSLNQPGRTVYKSAGNKEELIMGLESILAEASDFDSSAEFGN